jgi:predicted deacylase
MAGGIGGRSIPLWLMLFLACSSWSQQIIEYTEMGGIYALGYPVPLPIGSLTPVDGFRTYAALEARHQELALISDWVQAIEVGVTAAGRPVWAYQLSDVDTETVTGLLEPAMLITAAAHAREWASPEVVTALFEHLVEHNLDGGITQYLMENASIVIVPVVNVDGFLHTQRYPAQATIGGDPTSVLVPRDGRMRRKNMVGVDEELLTFDDHLLGTDLNRQWPPFWGMQVMDSDPFAITYQGAEALIEPEVQAVLAAAELEPSDRLRLFMDFHSFAKALIVPLTLNKRRNAITADLAAQLQQHLAALGSDYNVFLLERAQGVGAADEYFAETFGIPALTIEIEPGSIGAVEYGGFGAPRDGFMLPDSEIARVRGQLVEDTLLALYRQAGPPSVEAVEIFDQGTDTRLYAARWQRQPDQSRLLQVEQQSPLQPGQAYTLWVAFDKPMRWRVDGEIALFPGQSIAVAPLVQLQGKSTQITLDSAAAAWLPESGGGPTGFHRYRDDAFALDFKLPPIADSKLRLHLTVEDLSGLSLDADPTTPVDWHDGGWSGYEDEFGIPGDTGGFDAAITLRVGNVAMQTCCGLARIRAIDPS